MSERKKLLNPRPLPISLCHYFKKSLIQYTQNFYFFFFWPYSVTCGILVPQPGIEPACSALEMWSLNYWITRKVLVYAKLLRSFSSVKGHLTFFFFWIHGAQFTPHCSLLTVIAQCLIKQCTSLKKVHYWDFSGGPVIKTFPSHADRGCQFHP